MHQQVKVAYVSGQGMSEMGIAIGLIAVVAIVGLTMLGGSVQNGIGAHRASLQSDALAQLSAQNAAMSMPGGPASVPASTYATPAQPSSSGASLTLGNGQMLDVGQYPVDLGQSIETAGANGTMNQLLATMETIVAQAKNSAAISQDEANRLMAIAKQGHRIADLEGVMERGLLNGEDPAKVYNGNIGFNEGARADSGETARLLDLLDQAKSVGALRDNVLDQSVTLLVNQIVNIANGAEGAANSALAGETRFQSVGDYGKWVAALLTQRDEVLGINTQQSLLELGASGVTNQKANAICQAGRAGDNCR